ncbi:MAG: diacylglycerol kinase family protein [Eubacterium sp.]|nr:diacylglycerol kinase family protein [Eubacterium sp.]
MRKRMLFIYNPLSGKGLIKNSLSDIISTFTEAGYDVICHPTSSRGDGQRTVEELGDRAEVIVVSGGDGTLDEIVTGMMNSGSSIPVGYIPSGSTNDFAASLGISKDMVTAAEDITLGDLYQCDVGAFNSTYFVYVAAFGMFTHVSYETDQTMKNTFGRLAYLMEAGKEVFNVPSYHIRLDVDGQVSEGNYIYGMITNARSVGGIRGITGNAVDMNDGLFEVTMVRTPLNPLDLSEIISTLLSGDGHSALVETYKAKKVILEPMEEIDWTLDGEFGDKHKTVVIENKHKVLKLFLNRRRV